MATPIPKDLEKHGGWEFNETFKETPLKVGQIWRKCGPVDAIKIKMVMQEGHKEYDGGLKGISVYMSKLPRNACRVTWRKNGTFIPGNTKQIMEFLKENHYALAYSGNKPIVINYNYDDIDLMDVNAIDKLNFDMDPNSKWIHKDAESLFKVKYSHNNHNCC